MQQLPFYDEPRGTGKLSRYMRGLGQAIRQLPEPVSSNEIAVERYRNGFVMRNRRRSLNSFSDSETGSARWQ